MQRVFLEVRRNVCWSRGRRGIRRSSRVRRSGAPTAVLGHAIADLVLGVGPRNFEPWEDRSLPSSLSRASRSPVRTFFHSHFLTGNPYGLFLQLVIAVRKSVRTFHCGRFTVGRLALLFLESADLRSPLLTGDCGGLCFLVRGDLLLGRAGLLAASLWLGLSCHYVSSVAVVGSRSLETRHHALPASKVARARCVLLTWMRMPGLGAQQSSVEALLLAAFFGEYCKRRHVGGPRWRSRDPLAVAVDLESCLMGSRANSDSGCP
jgi:hypothetical protein